MTTRSIQLSYQLVRQPDFLFYKNDLPSHLFYIIYYDISLYFFYDIPFRTSPQRTKVPLHFDDCIDDMLEIFIFIFIVYQVLLSEASYCYLY